MSGVPSQIISFLKNNFGVFLAFGIRGTGMLFGLLSGIILARLLGAENYGLYALSMAWLTSLTLICSGGYDVSTLRFIGIFKDQNKTPHIQSFLKQARRDSLLFSGFIIAVFLAVLFFLPNLDKHLVGLVLLCLPFFSYLIIRMAVLRGYGEYLLAISADNCLRNILLVLIFGWFFVYDKQAHFTAIAPLSVILLSTLIAILLVEWRIALFQKQHKPSDDIISAEEKKSWRHSSLRLMIVNISRLVLGKIDMAILPLFMSVAFAGIYDAAIKWVSLIWFAQNTLVRVFGPKMAALHAKGDTVALQNHIHKVSLFIFIPSCILAIAIFILSPFLMALYGDTFLSGVTTLRILIIGYLITAFAGSSHLLINMLGDEKISMNISLQTLTLNIILNFILIPLYHIEGAAIATCLSLVYMSIKRVYFLKKNYQINCLPYLKK